MQMIRFTSVALAFAACVLARSAGLLLAPCILLAQDNARGFSKRPTIGVALEGGGAKGLAHIGVLQWF
jgi:predicted acylesterase/phospholipase RssA